ncbi:MAG: L-lactate dehydrogenase [Clostridia bacterium]|nr:L-lactate dehydrogenase [Clostridia bacterium]
MRKVTIIGAGNVGATIAYTLAIEGIANEILMIDIRQEKAEGEAMDIAQGAPFYAGTQVHAGDYSDAADSDIVVITMGFARKPDQTRLQLAQANVDILKEIAPKITKYAPNAIYLIVSNPVDVMTYAFHKLTNVPESHILGSGTILDTARLRSCIASKLEISKQNVHAHVFGEHGDSSFIPWSQATVSSVSLNRYCETFGAIKGVPVMLDHAEIEAYVRTSGAQIIARKGATFYAVAVAAVHICKCVFGRNDTVLTVSTMLRGEYGIDGVCMSMLTVVGDEGVKARIVSDLTPEEVKKMQHSADCLHRVIDELDIE